MSAFRLAIRRRPEPANRDVNEEWAVIKLQPIDYRVPDRPVVEEVVKLARDTLGAKATPGDHLQGQFIVHGEPPMWTLEDPGIPSLYREPLSRIASPRLATD